MAESIAKPVRDLSRGMEIIATGNWDYKIGASSSDEIGQLSRAFDSMVANLKATTASRDELEKEIAFKKLAETKILKLSEAVEQCSVSIVITDVEGHIEYVNPAFERHTGYTAQEVLGRNSRILKSGTHPASFYANLWNTIKGGKVWRGEFRNVTKSGDLVWEYVSISPIRGADGEINAFVAVKENITERRKREEHLRNLTKKLEESNQELKKTTEELFVFNDAAIGREERIIELKKEINQLTHRLNLDPPFDLSFLENNRDPSI